MRSRIIPAAAAATVLALGWVIAAPVGAAQAVGVCPGSLCGPQGVLVLAAGEEGMGTAVAAEAAGSAVAGAGTASGVGGVSLGTVAGGTGGFLAGLAAFVGIKSWKAGNLSVADGGATGLTGGAGQPAGWVGSSTSSTNLGSGYDLVYTVAFTERAGSQTAVDYVMTIKRPAGQSQAVPGGYDGVEYKCSGGATGTAGSHGLGGTGPQTYTGVVLGCPAGQTLVKMWSWGSTGATNYYVPSWAPGYTAGVPAGMATVTRTLTCTNGATQVVQTASLPVNLSVAGSTAFADLTCPPGFFTQSFGATSTPAGGGAAQAVVPTTTVPAEVQSTNTAFPDCVTGVCVLRLFRVQPAPASVTDCGDYAMACPDWYPDPNRAGDYECHYGAHVVQLDFCSVYRVPGQILPNAKVNPDGTTTYVPWPPVPAPDAGSDPSPTSQECFPSGWSAFNPVQWVLMPVKCALSWAFVPSDATMQLQSMRTDINATSPGQYVNQVAGMFGGLNITEAGCQGPPLQLHGFGLDQTVYLFNACDPPMSTAAAWTKVVAGVVIVVFGSMACVRAVGSGFGWKPSAGGDS